MAFPEIHVAIMGIFKIIIILRFDWEHAVAQSVEPLLYKSEGREFDSRLFHWNFSLT